MPEAVSNSGPLIHLAEIGKFELLDIFSKIYIPRKIYEEVCNAGKPGEKELKKAKNFEIMEVPDEDVAFIRNELKRIRLDIGELQALCLCAKLGKKLFLTDDLEAREAGKELGFEVHGSVGIIARAYKMGMIGLGDAEIALNDLYFASKLFISKAIIDEAIEKLKRSKAS